MSGLLPIIVVVCELLLVVILGQQDLVITEYIDRNVGPCDMGFVAGESTFSFSALIDIRNRLDWPYKYYVGFGTVQRDGTEYIECELNLEFTACNEHKYGFYANTCYCNESMGTIYNLVINATVVEDYQGAFIFLWWGDFEKGARSTYWNLHREVVDPRLGRCRN